MQSVQFHIKLNIAAGRATSAPPVGPVLGQYRVNLVEFCKDFNSCTEMWDESIVLNVLIIGYTDGNFEYVIKMPSTVFLLKKVIEKEILSNTPRKKFFGIVTLQQLFELSSLFVSLEKELYNDTKIIGKLSTICSVVKSTGIYIL